MNFDNGKKKICMCVLANKALMIDNANKPHREHVSVCTIVRVF